MGFNSIDLPTGNLGRDNSETQNGVAGIDSSVRRLRIQLRTMKELKALRRVSTLSNLKLNSEQGSTGGDK